MGSAGRCARAGSIRTPPMIRRKVTKSLFRCERVVCRVKM